MVDDESLSGPALDAPEIFLDEVENSDSPSSTANTKSESISRQEVLAHKETAQVNRLRIILLFALFIAAVVVSVSVYFVTRRGEEQQIRSEFKGRALSLLNSFDEVIQQKMLAITSFSESITAYARASNSEWPFVTVTDFAERSETVSRMCLYCRLLKCFFSYLTLVAGA